MFLGLRLTVPLYDGGVRGSRLLAAQTELAAAETEHEAVRQRVRRELLALGSDLVRLQGGSRSETANLSAALLGLRNARTVYEELPGRLPSLFGAVRLYLAAVERSHGAMAEYLGAYNRLLQNVGARGIDHRDL